MPDLFINIRAAFASFNDALDGVSKKATGFTQNLSKSFGGLNSTLATLGVASGLSTAGFIAIGKAAINAQDDIGKMAQRVGSTAEELSALQFSAKLADVPIDTLAQSLKKLSVNMVETQAGTGEARSAFKALGISVEESQGNLKSSQQIIFEIADAFAGMQDGAGKTALAVRLFGRAGSEMIPLLNAGSKGLKENAEEARRFGIIISTEAAKAAEQFNDNLTRLAEQSRGFGLAIANDALPWLNKMVEQLLEGQRIAGGFGKAIRLFGFSGITSSNAAEKIAEITKKIKEQQDLLEKRRNAPLGFRGFTKQLEAEIADLEKQREFAKVLLRQELQAGPRTDDEPPGRPPGKAPKLPDEAALKKAAEDAKKLRELFKEVQQLGASIDVSIMFPKGKDFETNKKHLEDLKKLLTEGRKDWVAHAEAVFADAEAQDKAAAAGESFTQKIEKIRDATLDNIDPTRAWERQLKDLKLALDTNNLSLDAFNKAVRDNPLRRAVVDAIDPIAKFRRQLDEVKRLEELGPEKGGITKEEGTERIFQINEEIEAVQGLNKKLEESSSLAKDFGQAVSTAFEDAVIHMKGATEVAQSFIKTLAQIAIRATITKPLENALGSFLPRILGSIFGGGGGSSGGVGLPGRAGGGSVMAGMGYLVGERGPEVFLPRVNGSIVPNNKLASAGGVFNYNPVINNPTQESLPFIQRALAENAREIAKLKVADGYRRNDATRRAFG